METTTRRREARRTPDASQRQPRQPGAVRSDRGQVRASRPGVTTADRPRRPGEGPVVRPAPEAPRRAVPRPPAREPGTAERQMAAARPVRARRAAESERAMLPRMPFVLLVLALLGGGLICLLVINTTLGATSFRISQLQSTNATLATQEQLLQQQIAAAKSPAEIARRAYALGMRAEAGGNILDLARHRFYELPGQAGAVTALGADNATVPTTAASAAAGARAKVGSSAPSAGPTRKAPTSAHRRRSRR